MALAFAFQDVPPAPGRPATPGQATQQAPSAPPASSAPAEPGLVGMLFPLLMLLPVILLMFWSTRSQQKKQQAALADLKKGDRVLTQSGLVGKLVEIGERYAKLELAPGVKVEVLKSGLLGKDLGDAAAAVEKK